MSQPAADGTKVQKTPNAWKAFAHRRRVSGFGILVMGALILAFGVILIYTLIKIWPALQADLKPGKTPKVSVKISWFHLEYNLTQEKALLLVVVCSGALGAFLHVATSFSDYVGNRRLMRSWLWFYILRPVVGASLALLFYFAVRGGLFTTSSGSSDLNPYGMAALGAMVGLFSKQATNKLQEIFDTAFSVGQGQGDEARGDSIGNPTPVLAGIEPAQVTKGGEVVFTVKGTGFVPESQIQVSVLGAPDAVRKAVYKDAQTLVVTLDEADVQVTGMLTFTVFNPEPGGGTSEPDTVEIMDLADPGATAAGTTAAGATAAGATAAGATAAGATAAGATTAGATDAGATDPGATDPGATDPGATDPGATDPGATDPGATGAGGGGTPDPETPGEGGTPGAGG